MVTTSSDELAKDLSAPAITICPLDKDTGLGFRNVLQIAPVQDLKGKLIPQMCAGKEGPEIIDCIEDRALNRTLAVEYLTEGVQKDRSVPKEMFWTKEFSHTLMGICHTIQPPFSLGTTLIKEAIWIGLNDSYKFAIFVHDPNFFLMNYNPSLPLNVLQLVAPGIVTQRMLVVQHNNINVPHRYICSYHQVVSKNVFTGLATQSHCTASPSVSRSHCQRGLAVSSSGIHGHSVICQSVNTWINTG